jgi:hypothetical protein
MPSAGLVVILAAGVAGSALVSNHSTGASLAMALAPPLPCSPAWRGLQARHAYALPSRWAPRASLSRPARGEGKIRRVADVSCQARAARSTRCCRRQGDGRGQRRLILMEGP